MLGQPYSTAPWDEQGRATTIFEDMYLKMEVGIVILVVMMLTMCVMVRRLVVLPLTKCNRSIEQGVKIPGGGARRSCRHGGDL